MALASLWRALDHGTLSPVQTHQIRAMARLLEDQRPASAPAGAVRWRLARLVRAILRRVPRVLLALWRIADLLDKIGWPTIAAALPQ